MSEYIPTTDEVKARYAEIRPWEAVTIEEQIVMAFALRHDFNRWLAKHDAELLRKHADFLLTRADLSGWSFAARAAEYLQQEAAGIDGVDE